MKIRKIWKKRRRRCSTQIPNVNQNKETLFDSISIYRMHRNFFMVNKHSLCNHRSYEVGGVAGAEGLSVERATGVGVEDDDDEDDLAECPPPVLGRGDVLVE